MTNMTKEEIINDLRAEDDEGSENEHEHDEDDGDELVHQSVEGSGTSPKSKKKKKRSKAARALAALTGKRKDQVPQEVIDEVLKKVKEEVGEDAPGADEETVRQAMDYLKINDVIKGKAGLAGRGRKDMGEHKVGAFHLDYFSLIRIPSSFGVHNLFLTVSFYR